MNDEQDSVPTTDAEFDGALAAGLTESFEGDTSEEADGTGQANADEEGKQDAEGVDTGGDSKAEPIETGVQTETDDSGDNALPETVTDVADLIKAGETDKALQRLGDYGRGLQKLQGQLDQERGNTDSVRDLIAGAAASDPDAIDILGQVLASHGTSIEELFIAKTGIDPSELAKITGTQVRATKPDTNPRLDKIEERLKTQDAEKADYSWVTQYGASLSKYFEDSTGVKVDPAFIAKARAFLPTKASAEDIKYALMKTDPRAYEAAVAAKGSSKDAPNSASVSRGGKGSAKVDASALLNDPRKFEAYLNG